MKATAANAIKLMGRKWATWGEFKNALVRAGIVQSFYHDAPAEWIKAYNKAFARR
jgi:hypothetical protein